MDTTWLLLQSMEDFQKRMDNLQKRMDDMVLEMRDLRAAMDRQVTELRKDIRQVLWTLIAVLTAAVVSLMLSVLRA